MQWQGEINDWWAKPGGIRNREATYLFHQNQVRQSQLLRGSAGSPSVGRSWIAVPFICLLVGGVGVYQKDRAAGTPVSVARAKDRGS